MNDLSTVIKTRRKELGLTLRQIADAIGVKEATVQRWESGNIKSCRQEKLIPLADILKVSPSVLMGWGDKNDAVISHDGQHIGVLYDRADEKDKLLTHSVLDKYDDPGKVVSINTRRRNPGEMLEFDVYDEPAAAGLGNYLSEPVANREQFPAFMVPHGADFCIRISGDSMEPAVADRSTVFVRQTMTIDSGKVGVFVLNGSSFCKQLIIDREKGEVRLHSLNPKYQDIIVTAADDLRTIGQVL